MSHDEGLLGTFWFLKELFFGNIIFYIVYKLSKGRILPTIITLLAVTELACIFGLRVPYFGISHVSTYAAFFIAFGYLWKISDWDCNRWWIYGLGVVSVGVGALFSKNVAMSAQSPHTILLYAIPAITGTMAIFALCRKIGSYLHGMLQSAILFVGNHTLSIMALHFTAFKLVSYLLIKINHLPIERLVDFPVLSESMSKGWDILLYTIVGICLPLSCAWGWMHIKSLVKTKNFEKE